MAAPRKYPLELKERALRLWRSEQPRRPIAHVARELGIHPEVLRTWIRRDQADLELFRYVDGWYNPHRIQRALGWRSPNEYEAAYHVRLAAQPASSTLQPNPVGAR